MSTAIYDKTDKGREEIASRKFGLSPRLRPLLVMVDGKQPVDALLTKVSGLGLGPDHLVDLLQDGYIEVCAPTPAVEQAIPEQAAAAPPENRYLAVYEFYNETIKSAIGLRGYALQLKVEKASGLDELRQLRQPYLEAVLKAKGQQAATELGARLDALLG